MSGELLQQHIARELGESIHSASAKTELSENVGSPFGQRGVFGYPVGFGVVLACFGTSTLPM